LMARPCTSLPFSSAIARSASLAELISTKPKPRERPVTRSVITAADSQGPICAKSASRSAVVVSNERLPTKIFLPMASTFLGRPRGGPLGPLKAHRWLICNRTPTGPSGGRRLDPWRSAWRGRRRSVRVTAMDASLRPRYGPWGLVAGAAAGLGIEWSRQLAREGLDLVLVDRDPEALGAAAREIENAHRVAVRPAALDLGRPDLLDALRPHLDGREIGLLVYNAACSVVAPFLELEAAQVQTMLDVNCRAPLLLTHALAPAMVARGRGGVILLSSLSGSVGSAQLAVYAATKAFNLVAADALWAELRTHGVDVLAVQPGSTRTPGWLSSQPEHDE